MFRDIESSHHHEPHIEQWDSSKREHYPTEILNKYAIIHTPVTLFLPIEALPALTKIPQTLLEAEARFEAVREKDTTGFSGYFQDLPSEDQGKALVEQLGQSLATSLHPQYLYNHREPTAWKKALESFAVKRKLEQICQALKNSSPLKQEDLLWLDTFMASFVARLRARESMKAAESPHHRQVFADFRQKTIETVKRGRIAKYDRSDDEIFGTWNNVQRKNTLPLLAPQCLGDTLALEIAYNIGRVGRATVRRAIDLVGTTGFYAK